MSLVKITYILREVPCSKLCSICVMVLQRFRGFGSAKGTSLKKPQHVDIWQSDI
jgi:hypothetical protein